MSEFTDKLSDWAASNPVVSNAANFLKDPIGSAGKAVKNTAQDLQTVFTQKDPRRASFSIVDENGDIQEYDLSSGGRVYKRPDGTYTNQRGYAYLSTGDDGKLILNVSKSVADSDWFKTKFTENSTFKKVLNMFNANPSSETTITTTDEDGNTKNVTLAEAVKQYNDALGQYASNYEGISLLRDYYNNNTGLNLTDDQIRISENSLSKDSDKQDETKVIYIPDSWQSIYDFSKLASWDPETKTVSAKDFFNVYNLDKEGGISEEQWQELEAATEAELERAFSGIVSKNLNTEDPEAIKYAGDKLAKAIAAGKTLNNSKPDVSGLHAAAIFASSAGEEFVSKLSKTYGNLTEFIIGQTEWLTDSPIAPVSVGGEAIQDVLFLADTPRNAMLAALGAIGDDIASGALSEGNASNYIEEVKNALGDSWNVAHGDKDFTSEYKFLPGGNTLDEFTGTLDSDIDYMEKISGAAAGGKFVGNILEMAVEVYITEKTGGLVGGAIESSAMSIGRGLGLVFKGSKIKDQANLLTKLFLAASKTTAWTGNMLTQGFMDTVESDTGQLATQMLMSKELTDAQKQELYNAMASNTIYNVGASVVVDKMVPGFLETKPGRFVQTRAQKAAAALSLPGARVNISLAKLINGIGGGKKLSQATMDALNKEFLNFGVNDLNSYMVKAAEANYAATKQIASAKVGKSYTEALTGKTVKAASTTEAIDIAVNNKIRLQNMLDRVTKGFKAETEEILASPDIAKARAENYAAASKVVEAEGGVGKKAAVQEVNGVKVTSFAQEDSNYLVYKRNLDYMDRKEVYAIANKKELSAGDKEFQTALRTAVESFEASNSPKLVEALENYYQANMAFNKAMTDWEVAHGIMSKETYESLKATGFFGLEDEFYVQTIAIKPNASKFTDDYASAYAEYTKNYHRHVGDSYRIDPTHVTDQHISRKFDPEQNYLDPELANAARISSMAQAYQAKNWGKALLGVGMPLKEIDTEGKLTSSAEIRSAMKSADAASVSAVERLTKKKLQPVLDDEGIVTLGAAAQEEYDLEGKIARSEAKEAQKLGIANDEAVSRNVSKLSQEQVAENLGSISGAPTYGKVKSYEEYQSMVDSMPTKEMRTRAEKAVKTQEGAYDKTQKQRIKEFEAQKKAKLAEASKLESEASNIDKEIARIEKANASGQAKYEKKKAKAEADAKKAAEKAAKPKASKVGGAEAAEKQLKKDMRDAILYRSGIDIDGGFFPYDIKDVPSMFKESRMDQLDEIRTKKGVDLNSLAKTKKMPKPEDIFEKEYIDSVRAKYATPEPAAQPVSTPEIKMPDPFVPTDTAGKVAEATAKREEAARIRGEADSLKAPRSLSDKQKAVKAWNDAVKNESTLIPGLNKMWLQDAITSKSIDIPEEVMNNIKTQIANRNIAERTEIDLIDQAVLRSKDPNKTAREIEKWVDDLTKIREETGRFKELLEAQKKGVAPFAEASRSILGEIVDGTKIAFEKNPVSARVIELAKEQGIDPELVKDYMAVNALLRENGNGELVLRNDIQAATKKRIEKEMLSQIRAEDKIDTGMIKHVVKRFQDTIEETAKESWASIQKQLIDAGGNDFIDMSKNFDYVKREMEKFAGQFNAANVIPMIGADGELKYYEVSPLIADLYQSRPLANYSRLSEFFNKTSRIARISSTNLNATSVVNQCFRDPLNAYIGAGMYKGFKAYENEMAELFGPELVAHLQEEMSAAGWDIFTEGDKVAGRDLEKKAAAYIVETTGVDTFAKESTQNALFEAQRTAARGAKQGALDNLEYWNKQYKRSKMSLNDFIDKGARIVGAPGYKINESRELFLRKADYASAFNTALRQGKTVLEAKNIAEFVSRQATTNFGRMFMWGNSIVNAVPFLGAAINGSASFWRLVAIDPVGISTRFVTAGLAMMSLVAQSMTTKRDREIYKTVPEWMKQENVVFVYDGEVMKIPIPQELSAFLAPFRQAVEKSHPGVQSHEWLELLTNDLLEVSPIELDGFETLDEINIDGDPTIWDRLSREGSALVSQFAPPFVKAAYMDATGVDPYTGNPIDTSYKWVDEDGNVQIVDNNQSSFAKWFSGKLEAAGIEKSTSVCYKLLNAAFGSGLLNVADGITNLFQGNPSNGVIATQLNEGLQAVKVEPYQLSDPYLREFKATIKELEAEKNAMLSADGELATLSQQLSMLKETDSNYDTKRKNLIREYNQKTEDYRQRVLNTVQNYNNHYGSTYTSQQFAAVINLLTFDKSTLMPTNAYQSEQLSQLYYSAREQAYQTMIDMGFDSTTDNSIFGIARRNKYTGEVEIKYTSPTVILNMDNIAMGSGRVYAAELEQALKSAGLTKSARIQGYNDAKAKGSKALKQFKKEWNAEVAQAISETMNKYGSGNVINSGDAVQLLNEYFYISNTSYKVKDYLKDVFGEEE